MLRLIRELLGKPKVLVWASFGALLAFLAVSLLITKHNNNELRESLYKELTNIEAYEAENSRLTDEAIVFKRTIDDLKYGNDSLNNHIYELSKQVKARDREIERLEYLSSTIGKTDTLMLRDTIFREHAEVDTLIGDEWYSVRLHLGYPSTIVVSPEFKSEKVLVTHTTKEYVGKPKKFFLCRWFQRKHEVTRVEVVEESPYVREENKRIIEIVK